MTDTKRQPGEPEPELRTTDLGLGHCFPWEQNSIFPIFGLIFFPLGLPLHFQKGNAEGVKGMKSQAAYF